MRGLSAQSEGEGRGQAVSGRPRLLSVRTDRAGWLCACRVLGGGPAGLGLPAEERRLSGRLCALDGGHVPRWVLAVPCAAVPSSSVFSPRSVIGCPANTERLSDRQGRLILE